MESTTTPKSPAEFRKVAERAFRNANPDATAVFKWLHCKRVKWFDGSAGFSGVAEVAAPGYKVRTMVASFSHGAVTVR